MQRSCSSLRVSVKRVSPARDDAMIPALDTSESVSVDFPWSTCAITDMFLMLDFLSMMARIWSTVKFTWREGWRFRRGGEQGGYSHPFPTSTGSFYSSCIYFCPLPALPSRSEKSYKKKDMFETEPRKKESGHRLKTLPPDFQNYWVTIHHVATEWGWTQCTTIARKHGLLILDLKLNLQKEC